MGAVGTIGWVTMVAFGSLSSSFTRSIVGNDGALPRLLGAETHESSTVRGRARSPPPSWIIRRDTLINNPPKSLRSDLRVIGWLDEVIDLTQARAGRESGCGLSFGSADGDRLPLDAVEVPFLGDALQRMPPEVSEPDPAPGHEILHRA
jgi:hypothetical protein